jgi:hypothetical protein
MVRKLHTRKCGRLHSSTSRGWDLLEMVTVDRLTKVMNPTRHYSVHNSPPRTAYQSSTHSYTPLCWMHISTLHSHSCLRIPRQLFPSVLRPVFCTNAYYMPAHLMFLDLICRIKSDEQHTYRYSGWVFMLRVRKKTCRYAETSGTRSTNCRGQVLQHENWKGN